MNCTTEQIIEFTKYQDPTTLIIILIGGFIIGFGTGYYYTIKAHKIGK